MSGMLNSTPANAFDWSAVWPRKAVWLSRKKKPPAVQRKRAVSGAYRRSSWTCDFDVVCQ